MYFAITIFKGLMKDKVINANNNHCPCVSKVSLVSKCLVVVSVEGRAFACHGRMLAVLHMCTRSKNAPSLVFMCTGFETTYQSWRSSMSFSLYQAFAFFLVVLMQHLLLWNSDLDINYLNPGIHIGSV